MREYDDAVLECFLDKQLQLFPEAVAETLDEAEDFLEECMAVVVDSVEDVIEYFDEAGCQSFDFFHFTHFGELFDNFFEVFHRFV